MSPNLLRLARSCAKWRNGALLVATLFLIGWTLVPGRVTDLTASAVNDTAIVLTWTEVSTNSTGGSFGRYAVKVGPVGTFDWASAPYVATGNCAWPVMGSSPTGMGKKQACVLEGLQAKTAYAVQIVVFRCACNPATAGADFIGPPSNVAEVTTGERVGPMVVLRPPLGVDSVAIRSVELSDWPAVRFPLKGSFWLGDRRATFYDSAGVASVVGYLLVTRP